MYVKSALFWMVARCAVVASCSVDFAMKYPQMAIKHVHNKAVGETIVDPQKVKTKCTWR